MSAIQVETQTIETFYITMPGLDKKVRVSNPDNIPNLEKVLAKKYPAILRASWDHTIDKVIVNTRLTDFHISWLEPTDKGGLSLFLCESRSGSPTLTPCYGVVYYRKGRCDTDDSFIEIKNVSDTNCFP